MALFTDKYKDKVRVVNIGDSHELCGGCHVKNTKSIKKFAISSFENKGSNTYRITACTNDAIEDNLLIVAKPYNDNIVKNIYAQLDDIKALYHLNESDLEIIDKLNLKLAVIIKDHKKLKRDIKKGDASYLKHNITLNELIFRMNNVATEFDNALHTLGSFYEDEMRSREQLKEMKNVLTKCKDRIRNYRLPIIYDNYFVEEEEAVDAINEVGKELENKPIVIKNLNMRVDTARDLTLKLNATTDEMIKYAYFSELLIVYGNKYADKKEIANGLNKAELLYFKGSYKESFNLILKVLKSVDNDLVNKINKLCKN